MNQNINSMINPNGMPFKMVAQAPNNPFLQIPMMQQQQQFIIDQNQQQQIYGMHHNQQHQFQQQAAMNALVSASALDEDSGSSDGESQVLSTNPDQVKQFFEDFLKLTQHVDPTNIQLSNVIEQYNITFKQMPGDEEMKTEFSRMIQKYNPSASRAKKKNWNDNETKILCWIVIKACVLQNLDCRNIEDKVWDDIAKMMLGRTSESCKFKWLSLSKLNLQQIPWSNEEDQLLLSIIKDFNASNKGNKWSEICKELNSKSKKNVFRQGKQCRERWNNHLDPNINRGPWSDKEDLQLLKLILDKGKKWSDVSKELKSNRTENNVKNRFNSILKKEKQSMEESKGKVEANMSENDLIHLLIKKYQTRMNQGFTICKEEEAPKEQIMLFETVQKTDSPMGKIEKQKNKLKDLVQCEIITKENQSGSSLGQINSMVLEDGQRQLESQNKLNSFMQFGENNQNLNITDTQLQSQQYQQQYQQYLNQQLNNQTMNPEAISQNAFKGPFIPQGEQISQQSMSPGNSQHNTPQSQNHNQGLLQLFSANGGYNANNPGNAAQNQMMQQFLNQPQQQPQQSQFFQQQQQQKQQSEAPSTYQIRNAVELLSQGDAIQNMSLAFINPQTQELVEIDQQLLDEYTQNQVRLQLQQYTQNIKSSTSQMQTPQQTPQQTSQQSFQMMFNQLQNQRVGSNSPQSFNIFGKATSPNINHGMRANQAGNLSQQQQQHLMSMMGNPISPQTGNLFSIMQSMSPATSNFNTPNTGNNSADIRRINQMQQYSNFFNPIQQQQQQQFPVQGVQGQMYLQGNQNVNVAFNKDQLTFSPTRQNFVQYNQINPPL